MKYTILESISSWIFVLAFLKASEKNTGDVEGSILVAGAALVGFQCTSYFTQGALNPTVIIAIQFS